MLFRLVTARVTSCTSWEWTPRRTRNTTRRSTTFQKALATDPQETIYELAARRARFESGQQHVQAGKKLQQSGDLEKALVEFQKAFAVDPGSMIAFQEIKKPRTAGAEGQGLRQAGRKTADLGREERRRRAWR